jgi:predicted glycosyltransferase involved in capsule biosynthesis
MKDLTIIIPFYADSIQRVNNLNELSDILSSLEIKHFIIDCSDNQYHNYDENQQGMYKHIYPFPAEKFIPKSKMINYGVSLCKTKYAAWHDVDVRFDNEVYRISNYALKIGSKFVRPYNGIFVNVRENINPVIPNNLNKNGKIYEVLHMDSCGGALFFNVDDFLKIGGMNEKFKGWGFEDNELRVRILKYGYKIESISPYNCHHMDHPRSGGISSDANPFYKANEAEFKKVSEMSLEELKNYKFNSYV